MYQQQNAYFLFFLKVDNHPHYKTTSVIQKIILVSQTIAFLLKLSAVLREYLAVLGE